jgi:hypothetical protein
LGDEIKGHIVSADGELLDEFGEGDRVKVLRENSLKHLARQSELIEFLPKSSYVKIYTDPLHELKRSLTGVEMLFVIGLLEFISYETGILQHCNGRVLNRKGIAEITGSDVKTVDRIIAALVKKEVFGRHKTGKTVCFTVNPYLFCRGRMVSKTLMKLYEKSKWNKR